MVVLDADGRVIRPGAAVERHPLRAGGRAARRPSSAAAKARADAAGCVPVASFTITKLRWLRDHEPDAAARVGLFPRLEEAP